MRSNRLSAAIVIAGLTALPTSAPALEPGSDFSELFHPAGIVADAYTPSNSGLASGTCPATNLGVLDSAGGSIVGSTAGAGFDFRYNVSGCRDRGPDVIFEFTVDNSGLWFFDTCAVPACWDTTLMIREETGGGCPGDFVACDGDGCDACYSESRLVTFLTAGTTYYLIVDGRETYSSGDFEVTYSKSEPCQADVDCGDGVFCNGIETCDVATTECAGGAPCALYQTCDEVNDVCIDPDTCITWQAGAGSPYFRPSGCPGFAPWAFDDIQTSKHTTDVLDFYTTSIFARSTRPGASPLGAAYSVEQALWTVKGDGTCNPLSIIAGTECTNFGVVAPAGSPPDLMQCGGNMPSLPNNDGDFNRCEVDFFIGYRTEEIGAGFWISYRSATIGGPGAADEFGNDLSWQEDCPPTGFFWPHCGFTGCPSPNFAVAEVCQKPGFRCCGNSGSCSILTEGSPCDIPGPIGTLTTGIEACGGDPDEDGIDLACARDNCPDVFNPSQGDCDGDGEGDACEADPSEQDLDGDGVCNFLDNCPTIPNPGQEDCDGDGWGDPCDACPCDPNDDSDGDGVCGDVDICPGHDDNQDADDDGVPDGCDQCPCSDDGAAGALGDEDGDGVLNCNDKCNGLDDDVFAPECDGAIPTTSQWGLIVLALLLLAGGKIFFGIDAKRVTRS